MRSMWMIRAAGGSLVEPFRTHKIAAISFGVARLFHRPVNTAQLKEHAQRYYPDQAPQAHTNGAKQMRYVIEGINRGDWIITYDPKHRLYWMGIVTSDYRYRSTVPLPPATGTDYPYAHTRDVDWQPNISRDSLSLRAKGHLGVPVTVFPVANDVQSEVLQRIGR